MVMPDLKMATAIMAIRAIMAHYGHYGNGHSQIWHNQDWYPLKECTKAYSVVKRSCQSYEWFCKLVLKSDFTIQNWHVDQKQSHTFSNAPIFKDLFFRNWPKIKEPTWAQLIRASCAILSLSTVRAPHVFFTNLNNKISKTYVTDPPPQN